MLWLSSFLFSVTWSKEKKWVVPVQEAIQFFEGISLYDTKWLRLDEIYDANQLKNKLEQINEYHFWPFTNQTRCTVKKYIETYAHDKLLLQQIDEIERKKLWLYKFLQETEKKFRDIPVNLIEEKMKTHSSQSSFDDVKTFLIEGRCLESQFFRDSIDPSDPLHNKNTYKHTEFQVRSLISELNSTLFDMDEIALKKQVEWLLECLGNRRFDKDRPHEDAFSDLQKKMAHVTKQWLLVSLH